MGVEHLVHGKSLKKVLSFIKKQNLKEPGIPNTSSIFLKTGKVSKERVGISVYPLQEPAGTYLALAEPNENSDSTLQT